MVYSNVATLALTSYPSNYIVHRGIGGGSHSKAVFIQPTTVSKNTACVNHLGSDVTNTKVKSIGNLGQPAVKIAPLKLKSKVPDNKSKKEPTRQIPLPVTPAEYKKLLKPTAQTLPKDPLITQAKRGIKRKAFNIIPSNG